MISIGKNVKKNKPQNPGAGPRHTAAWLLAAAVAAAGLSACAPIPAGPEEYGAGRARLVLPSTDWEDLGSSNEALPLQPLPGSFPLQTRAVGLRGANKELLAVVLLQTNRTNKWQGPTLWTGACQQQPDLRVVDAAESSPVRIDCLQVKRWANNKGWMEKNHPAVVRWLDEHHATVNTAYTHLNYRYATEGGAYINVNAIVDQRLLWPKPRNNEEFLRAGLPVQEWSQKVVQAARTSVGMVDGFFALPPFPLPLPK